MAKAMMEADGVVVLPTPVHTRYPFRWSDTQDTWWLRMGVNASLLGLTCVVLAETVTTVDLYRRFPRLHGVDTRVITNGITTASVFMWPVLWDVTVGMERLVESPRMIFGFAWPMVVATFDLQYAMDKRSHNSMDKMATGLAMDGQSIISAAFAMGALLSGLKSVRGTHLILYALIATLALVIPQVAVPSHTPDRTIIFSVQKAALNYAIGYIIAGIGADFLAGGASRPLFGRM
jgi:hypothetical protein